MHSFHVSHDFFCPLVGLSKIVVQFLTHPMQTLRCCAYLLQSGVQLLYLRLGMWKKPEIGLSLLKRVFEHIIRVLNPSL